MMKVCDMIFITGGKYVGQYAIIHHITAKMIKITLLSTLLMTQILISNASLHNKVALENGDVVTNNLNEADGIQDQIKEQQHKVFNSIVELEELLHKLNVT
jgi:hypothetical protein